MGRVLGFLFKFRLVGSSADELDRNALLLRPFQDEGILDIGNHTDDLGMEFALLNGFEDRLTIGAFARAQDGDALSHPAPSFINSIPIAIL